MSFLASRRQTTRFMVYAVVCTLIAAFGSIGSVLASRLGIEYTLMGLFIGSALGAFIAVYESTIIGCITGLIAGLIFSPFAYYLIDLETAALIIFVMGLFGAIMGEPMAYFWNEASRITESENIVLDQDEFTNESENKCTSEESQK